MKLIAILLFFIYRSIAAGTYILRGLSHFTPYNIYLKICDTTNVIADIDVRTKQDGKIFLGVFREFNHIPVYIFLHSPWSRNSTQNFMGKRINVILGTTNESKWSPTILSHRMEDRR